MASAVFIQEAGAASQTLRFEDGGLVVTQSDARSAREITLSYLDIDLEGPAPAEPEARGLKRVLSALTGPRIHARFALFAPRRDALVVWQDAQAPEVVSELKRRWREARRRAVAVDFHAAPRREIARFETLLTRGIVSVEECAAAVARIAARATAGCDQ